MGESEQTVEHKLNELDQTFDRINKLLTCSVGTVQQSMYLKIQQQIRTLWVGALLICFLGFVVGSILAAHAITDMSRFEILGSRVTALERTMDVYHSPSNSTHTHEKEGDKK